MPYPAGLSVIEQALLTQPTCVRAFLSYAPASLSIGTAISNISGAQQDVVTEIPFTSPSGIVTGCKVGDTVDVGTSPGAVDIGRYRIRRNGTGGDTKLYIMETGEADPGLLPNDIRLYSIQPGHYLTIKRRINLWAKFPKIYPANVTQATIFQKDFDNPWVYETFTPPPVVRMGRHISTFVDAGQNYATISFAPEIDLWINSTTPVTWSWLPITTWTPQAGATTPAWSLTAGSASGSQGTYPNPGPFAAANVTYRVPIGLHLVQLTIASTASVGPASGTGIGTDCFRYVWVHDGTPNAPGPTFPPITINTASGSRDRTGRQMSLSLIDNDLSKIPDGSLVNFFTIPYFNGTPQLSYSFGRTFTGWLSTTTSSLTPGLKEGTAEIIGPAAVLSQLPAVSQELKRVNTPASWQEVAYQLCNPQYAAWYLLKYQTANTLEMFDFYLYRPGVDQASFPAPAFIVETGDVLSQVKNVLKRAALEFGSDSTGAFWIRKHPSMLDYPNRLATNVYGNAETPIRDTLTMPLIGSINWQRRFQNAVRNVVCEGFYIDGNQNTVAVKSTAPGGSAAQGTGEDHATSQIVVSQLDNNNRAGLLFAVNNNPYPNVTVDIPYFRDTLEPAVLPFVVLGIPSAYTPDGKAFNKRTIPVRVNDQYQAGLATYSVELEAETVDVAGITVATSATITTPGTPPAPPVADPCNPTSTGLVGTLLNGVFQTAEAGRSGLSLFAVTDVGNPFAIAMKAAILYPVPAGKTAYSFTCSTYSIDVSGETTFKVKTLKTGDDPYGTSGVTISPLSGVWYDAAGGSGITDIAYIAFIIYAQNRPFDNSHYHHQIAQIAVCFS